jgi:hypothetical protein
MAACSCSEWSTLAVSTREKLEQDGKDAVGTKKRIKMKDISMLSMLLLLYCCEFAQTCFSQLFATTPRQSLGRAHVAAAPVQRLCLSLSLFLAGSQSDECKSRLEQYRRRATAVTSQYKNSLRKWAEFWVAEKWKSSQSSQPATGKQWRATGQTGGQMTCCKGGQGKH